MAYSEELAGRIRDALEGVHGDITEKKMFGGIAFLLEGKMFVGVLKNVLVARVNPEEAPALLKRTGVKPMDFTGKPMKGFLYVSEKALKGDKELAEWIERCRAYVSTLPAKKKKK